MNPREAMRKLLEDREQRRLAHYAVKLEGPTARSERSVLQWDSRKFNESRGDLVGFKQEKGRLNMISLTKSVI